jgi:prephenate dehydrogenase
VADGTLTVGTLAVVGVGLMGGSLGLAARRAGVGEVLGVGRSRESLELALERGAVTAVCESLEEAAAAADLVVVATPVRLVVDHVRAALRASGPRTIVTDVGSTKGPLMRALTPDEQRRCVGGHPLCGSEAAGVANARATLTRGRPTSSPPARTSTPRRTGVSPASSPRSGRGPSPSTPRSTTASWPW